MPRLQEFDTIGELYRAIEAGLDRLAERLGEERLFLGPPAAQATEEHFRLPELVPVTDLASAHAAIDTIVEQGEGARGEWRDAHFGRLVAILDEYLDLRDADPGFEPARPVVAAHVREPQDGVPVPIITDPFTTRCVDLLNAVYEVILQLLARYFAHTDETQDHLDVLAQVSVGLMQGDQAARAARDAAARRPGIPRRDRRPDVRAVLRGRLPAPSPRCGVGPHEERLRDAASFAVRCGELCTLALMEPLAKVARALESYADQRHAAR